MRWSPEIKSSSFGECLTNIAFAWRNDAVHAACLIEWRDLNPSPPRSLARLLIILELGGREEREAPVILSRVSSILSSNSLKEMSVMRHDDVLAM